MKFFLQVYYCCFFSVLFNLTYGFINKIPSEKINYIFFAKILNFLPFPPSPIINSILFLVTTFLTLLCVFRPEKKFLKIGQSFFILITFSVFYSYGKISHSNHSWILSSILVCFFNETKNLKSTQNLFVLRLIQAILLSHYFISGIWKLRELIQERFQYSFQDIATEYIAYGIVGHAYQNNPLLDILLSVPGLLGFGYIFILLFQITSLTPVFLNRFFVFFGVLACLFHLAIGIVLNIYFNATVLAVVLFFIIAEFFPDKEDNRKLN